MCEAKKREIEGLGYKHFFFIFFLIIWNMQLWRMFVFTYSYLSRNATPFMLSVPSGDGRSCLSTTSCPLKLPSHYIHTYLKRLILLRMIRFNLKIYRHFKMYQLKYLWYFFHFNFLVDTPGDDWQIWDIFLYLK